MSVGFRAVQWNRDKLVYDGLLLATVVLYVTVFLIVVPRLEPPKDTLGEIDLRIRAFGSATFLMLTAILAIGPLTRLDPRFLPLLYNRRHFGVLTFCVALTHVWFMIDWYLVQDALPSLGTELTTWPDYGKFIGFPFKVLGIAALLVLFVMAATSHDFWLSFLTPPVWKALQRPYHRWLRHLSLARLPISARGRLRAGAVHRKARNTPGAPARRCGRSRPAPIAARNARGDQL
jgi:DMSO/TMAO reductase YedYZ heme-binding membrane subunit